MDPVPADGPSLAVDIGALNLTGVGDVLWDVEVVNGATPAQVVWQRRIASSRYGDGAGSASYVATCDADPTGDVSLNTVKVWVVGVYAAPVTTVGTFAAGGAGDVVGTPVAFQDPTATAPLTRQVRCDANSDVHVQLDVALMRPAQQGFFDVAISFDDIFCSAKFDCCQADATGTACASNLTLLHTADGARASTMVLGFACTAGPRADVETELYLDPLELDCTSPTDFDTGFGVDIALDPSGPAGNQCTPGVTGMADCAGVVSGTSPDTYLYQVAVFRGVEALTSGGASAQKTYWNVALGVKQPAIDGCWLRTRGTADNAHGSPDVTGGLIAAGTVYPYVRWHVKLGSCVQEQLTYDDPSAMVIPAYTGTAGAGEQFAYGYGPSLPAGPFNSCTDQAPRVYDYTGGAVTATVPAGCTQLYGELWGAGGGGAASAGHGGGGGYTVVNGVIVTPLTSYAVVVGEGGASPCDGQCSGGSFAAAFGGGGTAYQGNGGGGYSGVFTGTTPGQAAALAIGGGGGGGGGGTYQDHGAVGGGATGGTGAYGTLGSSHTGGGGGTQTAGGAYAYNDYPTTAAHGTSGAALLGGSTASGAGYGGGGGGGYFGGGSGGRDGYWNHRGGGGGSGFVKGGAGTLTAGSGTAPGNASSPNYAAGVGVGSATVNVRGGNGRVVLWFR